MNNYINRCVRALLILANITVATGLCMEKSDRMENPDTSNMTPIMNMDDVRPFLGKAILMTGNYYYTGEKTTRYGIVDNKLNTFWGGEGYDIFVVFALKEGASVTALIPNKIKGSGLRMRLATSEEKREIYNKTFSGELRFYPSSLNQGALQSILLEK